MEEIEPQKVRDIREGNWYWIDRAVLYLYGRRLKSSGMAVYNALASFTDSSQKCFPTHKGIAQLLGLSRRTVMRKINLIKQLGLIQSGQIGNNHVYSLLKIKSGVTNETKGCDKGDTPPVTSGSTNDKYITRIKNDNIDNKFIPKSEFTFKKFKPETREQLLAIDLATALDDQDGFPLYLSYARKYPESLLRRVLGDVKEIPINKIKKTRGALFNYLIQKHVQKTSHHHRD